MNLPEIILHQLSTQDNAFAFGSMKRNGESTQITIKANDFMFQSNPKAWM
jgi:hypothetical protein